MEGMNALTRFMRKVKIVGNCWEWQGKKWQNGYGVFFQDGKQVGAHRAAWQFFRSPIPPGLEIDHLCNNRSCVNPEHMELVTHAENMRRATGWKKQPVTHCKHGHEFTEENTSYTSDRKRVCRTCRRETMRRHRAQKARPEPRACLICGTVFTPDRHPNAKYCSAACNTRAYRQRMKE